MSDHQEADAGWTNGEGAGQVEPADGAAHPRKRTRSSDSDSSQTAEFNETSQKKIKIVVRIEDLLNGFNLSNFSNLE